MVLLPPGGLPEIVFSFDTTGSMSGCLAEVRGRLQDMIQRLQADIPAIRIAVFAHGDYCDSYRATQYVDFSTDVAELCKFVKSVGSTGGGGDGGECYELVLREVGEKLSWTPGSNRALVLIGDEPPHTPSFRENKQKIDWRKELKKLTTMGVKIYGVECGGGGIEFYTTISEQSGGRYLQLKDFSNVFDLLMAICYREQGADMLEAYEKEVRSRRGDGSLSKDVEGMFTALRDGAAAVPVSTKVTNTRGKKAEADPVLPKPASKIKTGKSKPTSNRKPKPKSIKKPSKKPLLMREEIPEDNFALKDMDWSPWVKGISPRRPQPQDADRWEKRWGDMKTGFRTKKIFSSKNNKPALYEIGVQVNRNGRRFVVLNTLCRHIPDGVHWETRLFGNKIVKAQVNKVVSQGCSVFVRRATFKTVKSHDKTVQSALLTYDYAWRRLRNIRTRARYVVKQGCTISSNKW
ncbi:uncharacterized protein LOC124275380 [Haliotis rubra]|uniref:uncharacterized protein LOC124275380 n=1 Tax=Haliotis rubra TaxID=36100 RepID=UPI001EE632AD|nr:uncharacterized protein LOC124275380 [Haliotis rubra]